MSELTSENSGGRERSEQSGTGEQVAQYSMRLFLIHSAHRAVQSCTREMQFRGRLPCSSMAGKVKLYCQRPTRQRDALSLPSTIAAAATVAKTSFGFEISYVKRVRFCYHHLSVIIFVKCCYSLMSLSSVVIIIIVICCFSSLFINVIIVGRRCCG